MKKLELQSKDELIEQIKLLKDQISELKIIILELPSEQEATEKSVKYLGKKDYGFIAGYNEAAIEIAKSRAISIREIEK